MFNSSQIGIFVKYWKWLIEKYFILPYDAFNGSLVEQFICWDAGHKINTIAKMKNHKQRVICFCPAPIGRVWYGQGQKASVSVLCIPDMSGIPTGHVWYCRNQNTDRIGTESLIHIFSYILNLLRSLWFTKSKWIVSISWTQILNMANYLVVVQNRKLTPKFLIE